MKTYEDGLKDAWKVAKKIGGTDNAYTCGELSDIFGSCSVSYVFDNFTVFEAIDAMENYDEIKVGDEVVDKNNWGIKGVVTKTNERYISIVEKEGKVNRLKKDEFNKTGRHFPQIEEMLEQMQEGEDE